MARVLRRYNSTIYGNYRKAYLIDGALTGVAMAAIMLVRDLISAIPMGAPENYITEIVLGVGIFWSCYQYRKQLEGEKVSLKELMLLGLGIGVVSGVVYGLSVWLNGSCLNADLVAYYNQQRIAQMEAADTSAEAKMAIEQVGRYTAGDWGFIAGFRSAVMSVLLAFFAALIFRTEKSPIREKNKKNR